MEIKLRLLKSEDILEVLEIYKPLITSANIPPEYDRPNLEDFSARVKNFAGE